MNFLPLEVRSGFRIRSLKISRIARIGSVAVAITVSLPLFAQANFGRILGSVQDQSGSIVFGATVTVTDVQRGISRSLATDQAGEYVAPDLFPGAYEVRVEAKGFKTFERADIVLEVGKDARVDVV